MKTMTCKQLGGACDYQFHGESFEEIAAKSRDHGTEMYNRGDEEHVEAMQEMQQLMQSPEEMHDWFEARKREFEALPNHI